MFEFKSRAFHFIRNISIITDKMYKVEVMDLIAKNVFLLLAIFLFVLLVKRT